MIDWVLINKVINYTVMLTKILYIIAVNVNKPQLYRAKTNRNNNQFEIK